MEIAEYYMVTDACWKRAGMGPYDGQLCIGCIEKRLGKQLTPRNFTDCPLIGATQSCLITHRRDSCLVSTTEQKSQSGLEARSKQSNYSTRGSTRLWNRNC
jgi:hypothetical protein